MGGLKTLSEVCKIAGVSRRAIQGYEKVSLVAAKEKNKYGHLLYDHEAVERIVQIRFYQQLGFKVREIRELVDAPEDVLKSELQKKIVQLEKEIEEKTGVLMRAQKMVEELGSK